MLVGLHQLGMGNGVKEFREIFPNICFAEINNMNELAYKFCSYLESIGIEVRTIGEKWKMRKSQEEDTKESVYPEFQTMHIYSEGTDMITVMREHYLKQPDVSSCFACIDSLLLKNSGTEYIKILKELQEKKVIVKTICVPNYEDLSNHSVMEELRYYMKQSLFTGNLTLDKYLINVFGSELYEWKKAGGVLFPQTIYGNNCCCLSNLKSKYVNVVAGKRVTVDTPENCSNHIHIFGPCIVVGVNVMDKDTLPSGIQKLLNERYNEENSKYCVENHGRAFKNYYGITNEIRQLELKENDIIIIIMPPYLTAVEPDYSLLNVYNNRPKSEPWFSDVPIHTNALANRAIAKDIVENCIEPIIESLDWGKEQKILVEGEGDGLPQLEVTKDLLEYLSMLRNNKYIIKKDESSLQQFGAIVMNCNPFTLGHQYLIEKALARVEYLYVFVVEEDKSQFSFMDRFEMVKRGTSHYDNIKVLPSGKFILSTITMPEYFEKESDQEAIINATEDIGIFGEYIVPLLDINTRFVGEEPFDKITRQYNNEMKRSLPKKGVEVIEIPRLIVEDNTVSASTVRNLLREGNIEKVRKLLPETTFDYLKNQSVIFRKE